MCEKGLKNKEVVITRLARTSIREIYEYIKNREKSVSKSHYVRESIINKCLSLKDFSGYSKEPYLEEFPGEYRSVSLWSYVIINIVKEKQVRVLNVVHGQEHPEARKKLE
ncbi:MAG: type II toxin-antitoxin system RelE/ParE family toxin [Bacteroidales bacterium]|nr:type II toxin-antitoxin system RelE/ParE family toxin [Bacteroidales bacterium]